MVEEMGLGALRKNKTERPVNILPDKSDSSERTMPEDLLKLPHKIRDLPKRVRLPINTHN